MLPKNFYIPGSFRPVRRQQREEQDTRPSWCFEDRLEISTESIKGDNWLLNNFAVPSAISSGKTTPRLFHVNAVTVSRADFYRSRDRSGGCFYLTTCLPFLLRLLLSLSYVCVYLSDTCVLFLTDDFPES